MRERYKVDLEGNHQARLYDFVADGGTGGEALAAFDDILLAERICRLLNEDEARKQAARAYVKSINNMRRFNEWTE